MWTSAMPERDLDAVWTVLETEPPTSGIEVSGTGFELNAGEVLAGVDADLQRQLLIPLLPGEAASTDTRGRAVHMLRVTVDGEHFLALVCRAAELHTVFTQFARELLSSLQGAASPARAAVATLDRWRSLFSDAVRAGLIGEPALVGLLGELLTLEQLLARGAASHLAYWTGPDGSQHDLRVPSRALEVKSTLAREGRIVGISSIEQLEPPPSARLWMTHHRFEADPGGYNLGDAATRVLSAGAGRVELATSLHKVGVNLDYLQPYDERRYRLVESRTYAVPQASFPRITRPSFVGGAVPPGVLRISYSIDLTNEPPSPLAQGDEEQLLAEMAEETLGGMGS
jgi:hypothetical protein